MLPLIGNSRPLWDTCIHYETWDIFPGCRNYLGHAALWGPIALVYFLDMTVWYFVISALTGGLVGARGRHHEVCEAILFSSLKVQVCSPVTLKRCSILKSITFSLFEAKSRSFKLELPF